MPMAMHNDGLSSTPIGGDKQESMQQMRAFRDAGLKAPDVKLAGASKLTGAREPRYAAIALWGARDFDQLLLDMNTLEAVSPGELQKLELFVMTMAGFMQSGQEEFIERAKDLFYNVSTFDTERHTNGRMASSALFSFAGHIGTWAGQVILYAVKFPKVRMLADRMRMEWMLAQPRKKYFLGVRVNSANGADAPVLKNTFMAPAAWAFIPQAVLFRGYGSGIEVPPMGYLSAEMGPFFADSQLIQDILDQKENILAPQIQIQERVVTVHTDISEDQKMLFHSKGFAAGLEEGRKSSSTNSNGNAEAEKKILELESKIVTLNGMLLENADAAEEYEPQPDADYQDLSTADITYRIGEEGLAWIDSPAYHVTVIKTIVQDEAALRLMAKAAADFRKVKKPQTEVKK